MRQSAAVQVHRTASHERSPALRGGAAEAGVLDAQRLPGSLFRYVFMKWAIQPVLRSASTWAWDVRASMKGSNPPSSTEESWCSVSPTR